MRALWTSASGLAANQARLDTIANNMANLNTTGYKQQDVQFKDILYAQFPQKPEVGQIKDASQPRQSTNGLRIGQGVWTVGLTQNFLQGALQQTGNLTDLAIEGNGFFKVETRDPQGNIFAGYTRDGSFKVTNRGDQQNPQFILTDAAGQPVLDTNDQAIDLTGYDLSSLQIGTDGTVTAKQPGGTRQQVAQLDLVEIAHPETNLVPASGNLYALNSSANPNVVTRQAYTNAADRPTIKQGYLEQSNVDLPSMMTEMMQTQQVYNMNAKALETTDQMMGMANNLRG